MKFKLISIDKNKNIDLEWILTKENEVTGSFSMSVSNDEPTDNFFNSFRGLNKHVAEIIGRPDDIDKIEIRKIHMSYDIKINGTRIVFTSVHSCKAGYYAFNTPAILDISEEDDKKLPEGCFEDLKKVIREAEKYADGYRKQTNLFYIPRAENDEPESEKKAIDPVHVDEKKVGRIFARERESSFQKDCKKLQLNELISLYNLLIKNNAGNVDPKNSRMNFVRSLIMILGEKEEKTILKEAAKEIASHSGSAA